MKPIIVEKTPEEIREMYQESFIHHEDTEAICAECCGTKKLTVYNHYWRYKNTKKGCKHDWRKCD